MTPERRDELRRNGERMLQSTACAAPYEISPSEVLELLNESQDQMYLRGNQLAAISTVLMANTPITLAATRLPKDHALYTAAFQDAVSAVEREIRWRERAESAEINLTMAEANCEELERQVNKLIESCYYRTKAGKVHWKQGKWFGTSTADNTDPAAFEQAMSAIRRNAGISEDDGAGEDEAGSDDPAPKSRHDWCADANCETCNRRFAADKQSYDDLAASGGIVGAP